MSWDIFSAFNFGSFISSYVVLFAIMNIPGAIPIIYSLEKRGKTIKAGKATIAVLVIYVGFFFAGEGLLRLFGVDISSFAIAGSIIVFVIGMCMTLDINIGSDSGDGTVNKDATIVPVVFPLMIGAGALTALLSLRSQFRAINILLAVLAIAATVYLAVKAVKKLRKYLGDGFLATAQRVFGFILVAIAVKLFTSNIMGLIKSLQ